MAQISPNVGVPTVSPDATPGNDYQNVRASPEQMGGLIAQGVEKLGAGVTKAGDTFGEAQTDDASNNYQKAASQIVENFKSLNGDDRLKAQNSTKKQLDDLYAASRGGLTRADQQVRFDSVNRPYTDRYLLGQISTASIDAANTFNTKVNNDSFENAHSMAATAGTMNNGAGNEATLAVARAKAITAQSKYLRDNGLEGNQDAVNASMEKANSVYASYAEAMAAGSPQGALRAEKFLERPEVIRGLGSGYAIVYNQVKGQAAEAQSHVDNAAADHAVVSGAAPAPQTGTPKQSFFIGDSIADGLKTAAKGQGVTQVGLSPEKVLANINTMNPADLAGKQIVLSSGASNSPQNVGLVADQIDALKGRGVNPADIKVVGVGDRQDFAGVNEKLATIAKEKGAIFTGALDPSNLSADRVHPANYGAVRASSVTPAPIFTQAAAANPAGFSAAGLARTAQIESGGRANAVNGSMHGMFQFSPGTWATFGHGSPYDVTASTEAAQKYAAANSAALTNVLGRKPTDAELYVAHQQGLGGATALFTHPNEPAVDVLTPVYGGNRAIAEKAIRGNGGDPNAPASTFVNLWTGKFNGAKGATPYVPAGGQTMTMPAAGLPAALPPEQEPDPLRTTQSTEDAVYRPDAAPGATDTAMTPPAAPGVQTAQNLNARKIQWIQEQDWTDERKARATQAAELQYRTAAIAAEATAKDKTEKNNAAANDYVSEMMKGPSTDIVGRIANDQRITSFETRKALWDLALKSSGENNPAVYGKGFNDVYQKILLPPGDPNRISDPTDVLKRGADGGDLTFSGTQKLLTIMNESRKSVDGDGIHQVKGAAYNNAKRYLSFEEDTGFGTKIRDPKGEQLFDTKFTPMFEAAFDNWTVKQGKDPYEFPLFDPKKMDEFLQKIRPKAQRDADRLGALGESPAAAEAPNAPLPPAPQGIDQAKWAPIVSQPPVGKNGVIAHNAWANIVSGMVDDPAKNVPLWNASAFVRNGAPRGEAVLSKLGIPYESKGRPEDVGAEPPPGLQAGPLPREKSQYEIEDEAAKERRGTWWAARKAELSNLFASPDWKNMSPEEFHRLVGIPKPKIDEGR